MEIQSCGESVIFDSFTTIAFNINLKHTNTYLIGAEIEVRTQSCLQ